MNVVVYATVQQTVATNLRANLPLAMGRPLLGEVASAAADRVYAPHAGGVVFTDDRASIEWETNKVLFRYLLRSMVGD